MRKLLAVFIVALAIAGPAAAQGPKGNPTDPTAIGNHPALYGLCTAYFSGQGGEKGNKNSAPPFAALEQAAKDNDQSVEEFCDGVTPSNGTGKGSDNSKAPNPID